MSDITRELVVHVIDRQAFKTGTESEYFTNAKLPDVQAWLSEHNLVAVPIDDLKLIAGKCNSVNLVANELIAAAQNTTNEDK